MKIIRSVLLIFVAFQIFTILAGAQSPYPSYVYNYEGQPVPAPYSYIPARVVYGNETAEKYRLKEPEDFFVGPDGLLYICDTGNNRVLVMTKEYKIIREISEVVGISGAAETLNKPVGVFVTNAGEIYISDTDNNRIIVINSDNQVLKQVVSPKIELLSEEYIFLPTKLVVDISGRVYCLARNMNYGIMVFDKELNFESFIGANKVTVSPIELFWKAISTKEQKDKMQLFVPTEYNNVFMDQDRFIYATTNQLDKYKVWSTISSRDLSGQVSPIRRLNLSGDDVLKRNGNYPPIGDLSINIVDNDGGASEIIDVVADSQGIYSILDMRQGRVFSYDADGNLLYTFGGIGDEIGTLRGPSAIEKFGDNYIVLDKLKSSITVYSPTDYGNLINSAITSYTNREFDKSTELWKEVLTKNAVCEYAYVGLGKGYLRSKEYQEAMNCFKLGNDRRYYSKALKLHMGELVDQYFGYFATGILVLLAGIIIFVVLYRRKKVKSNE